MNITVAAGRRKERTEYQSLACNVRGRDGIEG
jgi:hypothetical protein